MNDIIRMLDGYPENPAYTHSL